MRTTFFIGLLSVVSSYSYYKSDSSYKLNKTTNSFVHIVPNNCISFTIGSGTGCDWICSYCANSLGTNNYYFTDNVCTYGTGGCVGNPQVGKVYTCCSL
jgi:hypothetical protein